MVKILLSLHITICDNDTQLPNALSQSLLLIWIDTPDSSTLYYWQRTHNNLSIKIKLLYIQYMSQTNIIVENGLAD